MSGTEKPAKRRRARRRLTGVRGRVLVEPSETHAALAAQLITQELCRCLESAPRASFFLAGGRTPEATYGQLAKVALDWRRIDFFWGDERCVPRSDSRSNFDLARRQLLEPVGAAPETIHRIPAERGAAAARGSYEAQLREYFSPSSARPDVVLLGVGEDGHTASLFGDVADWGESEGWVEVSHAPVAPRRRVTVTIELLAAARQVIFLVAGRRKATIVSRVLDGSSEGAAAEIARRARRTTWILDEAAAGDLDSGRDDS